MSEFELGFPPLHARWLKDFLGGPIPAEPNTTCGDCPMIKAEPAAEVRFGERQKCCTFFPELPSFSVGRLLLDEDPSMARGRELVRTRIGYGQQVTPLGIGRPAIYLKIYGGGDTFGLAHALKCPYYIDEAGGLCGVWRHREATCFTWFCKHERGEIGFVYWRAMRRLLKAAEQRLSHVIAVELGIDEGAARASAATHATLSRDEDPAFFRSIWGPWADREVEYYQACAKVVEDLDWAGVRARCGAMLDPFIAEAREGQALLADRTPLPELVRIRPLRRVRGDEHQTVLKTYSAYDALAVPHVTALALLEIDGRPTETVLRELADKGVDCPLLERLMDVGLLEDAAKL